MAIPWAPKVIVGPRPLKSLVKASTCFVHCYHEVKLYRKIKLNPPLLVTMIYPIKQSALIFRTLIFSDNSKTIHPRTLKMWSVHTKSMFAVILHYLWGSLDLWQKFWPPLSGAYGRKILNRVFRHVRHDCEIYHRFYLVLHPRIDQKPLSNLLDLQMHIKPPWAPLV